MKIAIFIFTLQKQKDGLMLLQWHLIPCHANNCHQHQGAKYGPY
jgi:hypothetical protein